MKLQLKRRFIVDVDFDLLLDNVDANLLKPEKNERSGSGCNQNRKSSYSMTHDDDYLATYPVKILKTVFSRT
jgi:hypothetical protein